MGEIENAMIHLLTIRDSIAKPQDIDNMTNFQMGVYTNMFQKICVRCEDLKAYAMEHRGEIIKVNIYHRSPESRERTVKRLKDCHAIPSGQHSCGRNSRLQCR